MATIGARLERLPYSRFHAGLLVMGGLGYTFEAMDQAVVAFVLTVVSKPNAWNLTSVETGILGAAAYVGFFFGALLCGVLADRFGRKRVMIGAVVLYCAATVGNALVHDWHQFCVWRVIAGVGVGAESTIVAPYLSEFVSSKYRGRFTAAVAGFFSFGFVGAALLGNWLVPHHWRMALLLTATPIVLVLWWWKALPESPRWLERKGHLAEADAIVARAERETERGRGPLPAPAADTPVAPVVGGSALANLAALFSPRLWKLTVMSLIMWFALVACYYAFFTWIPTLLAQSGHTVAKSFSYSLIIFLAQIPGYYSSALLVERIGRRGLIAGYLVGGALSALWLALANNDVMIIAAGVSLSFFMNGAFGGLYVYTPEIFPTEIRVTGVGVASAFGRIGSITAPVLVGWLFPRLGFAGVFGVATGVLLTGALAVVLLGIKTEGRPLEAIAAGELAP
ncbi:MAG TPA: MFS transporter [Caulobacteraceae bacterium]|jgi:putative MFS transporter|nr:MFS transporter [Caulobacteraceae bacterium]